MPVSAAPYGTWRSPVTPEEITAASVWLTEPHFEDGSLYWLEGRSGDNSQGEPYVTIVRLDQTGKRSDVFDTSFSARTTVHEYGGGAYTVANGIVYFANFFADGQLYQVRPGGVPFPITSGKGCRYADLVFDRARKRLICIREDHTTGAPRNEIVAIDGKGTTSVLASGNDFYSSPRISSDGSGIAWLTWSFPDMPWTNTQLWVASFDADGRLTRPRHVAGFGNESVFQPDWSPDGVLYFVSDVSGWWNIYRVQENTTEPVAPRKADFGQAQWLFGMSTYAFAGNGRLVCAHAEDGIWRLSVINPADLAFRDYALPFQEISYVSAAGNKAFFCAGSPKESLAIVQMDLDSGEFAVLRSSTPIRPQLMPYFSSPVPIKFPTTNNRSAYAFYYPPFNPDYAAPPGDLPPLLVKTHGGPTAAATTTLDLRLQYWTSRGFAVVVVNYSGSTGYGKEYRFRLCQQWGIADVDDCVHAAGYLASKGLVDPGKLLISGTSAGGYTTLCALTFRRAFAAGASYYGIADLESFVRDTHKFESRYMEWLIGPYPERNPDYQERSPVLHVNQVEVPVIFFQGEEDRVVPASQSATMAQALRQRNLACEYLVFKGEQHGFRRAENVKRALQEELLFYQRHVLHCAPTGDLSDGTGA